MLSRSCKLIASVRIDVKLKYDSAIVVRDTLDHYTSGPIYPQFLKRVMPLVVNVLRGPCIFQSLSIDQVCGSQAASWYHADPFGK